MTQAIFLSYASQDAAAARRLCDALRSAGLEVWFDQSELRGGDAWDASIRKQIKECALFIPLISASTDAREEGYFRLEWKLAVDRSHLMADDKAFFFPVLLDDVAEPTARVPDKFRERQWTRLGTQMSDDAATKAFAERVAKLVGGGGVSSRNASNSPPNGEINKNLVGWAGVLPTDQMLEPRGQNTRPPYNTFDSRKVTKPSGNDGDKSVISRDQQAPSIAAPSIAVLAFANRSASADDEYFSDGLADELLNVLAKIKGLRVAARTSAFSFKGKQATVAEIGRALNVATVLEGSVRKSGNRVRISVELVKVADGYHLWSETYDRTLDDIFAVQDDIAQAVVKELRSTLMGDAATVTSNKTIIAEIASAATDRSDNSEAQRLFLQGRYLLGRKSEEDLTRSIEYLQAAVALDPDFALAWAVLAQAQSDAGGWGIAPVHEANARALTAANKALALAPGLVQAHLSMASIQMSYQWDWVSAEASIQRALQLAPDNADVLTAAMRLSFCMRHFDEAETFGQRAVALDPLNAASYRMLAMALYSAGKLDSAADIMRQSLELSPDAIASRHVLGIVLSMQGRHEEALAETMLEKAEWARLTVLSIVRWSMGTDADKLESDNALATLVEKRAHSSAVQISSLYAIRGDADATFLWLERAYQQRDAGLVYSNALPFFDPVKHDPRWHPFLKKMGLAD